MLEEECGVTLFVRTPHEVRLTPEGVIMLKSCDEMKQKLEAGLKEIQELNDGKAGSIRIGCLEAMDTSTFVEPSASFFSRKYTDIDISLERRSFAELRNKLQSGHLDIIFTLDFDVKTLDNIACNIYYPVQALFLISRNHPLADKEDLCPADFADQTFLVPEETDSPRREEELRELCRKR